MRRVPGRRGVLLFLEFVMAVGCYAPPYRGMWRRVLGAVAGVALAALGIGEGYGWFGLGLVEGTPRDAGRRAAGTALVGAVCAIAWGAGIVT